MNIAESYPGDNKFRAQARIHQSNFRESVLKIDYDPNDRKAKYGNLLPKEEAKKGLIFFEGYREDILAVAKKRYGKITGKALYSNLLRSEHIPLNIFTPMGLNLPKTAALFKEIIDQPIASIKSIEIEYAGKDDPSCYLKDRTSFDAFVSYITEDKRKGGVGIEVKYTEVGYKIGDKENDDINKEDHPYKLVTGGCGYFTNPNDKDLHYDNLRQIWRNHILGESMVQNGDFDIFHYIHLYPLKNSHFHKEAIPKYLTKLTDKGKMSFVSLTYEKIFDLMSKHFSQPSESEWVEYLRKRYLF
jgi:hypothetical protein